MVNCELCRVYGSSGYNHRADSARDAYARRVAATWYGYREFAACRGAVAVHGRYDISENSMRPTFGVGVEPLRFGCELEGEKD